MSVITRVECSGSVGKARKSASVMCASKPWTSGSWTMHSVEVKVIMIFDFKKRRWVVANESWRGATGKHVGRG